MEISSPVLLDCLDELRANAPEVDLQPSVAREVLQKLGQQGLYRWPVARDLGGLAASAQELWDVSEALAGACGTTHFVQAQHQGGIGFIVRSDNYELVRRHLPALLAGDRLCGVAFAHCRRPQSPLRVSRQRGQLVFEGEAPWCTGWGLVDEVVVAGRDERGVDVYALVPATSPGLTARHPVRLAAMNASATVALHLDRVQVPQERWLLDQTAAEMAQRDFRSQLGYAALPLGLTREACRLIEERRPGSVVVETFLTSCRDLRARALAWKGNEQEALEIRSQANLLGQRAAQAAVISVGGQANQFEHPACRLLREASFYFLTQLNEPLREAYLARLAEPSS